MVTAAEILDRLKNIKHLKSDISLARLLGVKQSTVPNWRKRNTIPYGLIVKLCNKGGIPLDKVFAGAVVPDIIVLKEIKKALQTPISTEDLKKLPISEIKRVKMEVEIRGNVNLLLIKEWIDEFWEGTSKEERIWFSVQFSKCFPEYIEWLKKRLEPSK